MTIKPAPHHDLYAKLGHGAARLWQLTTNWKRRHKIAAKLVEFCVAVVLLMLFLVSLATPKITPTQGWLSDMNERGISVGISESNIEPTGRAACNFIQEGGSKVQLAASFSDEGRISYANAFYAIEQLENWFC